METLIKKDVQHNSAYYTIHWSTLQELEKYRVINSVPSVAGIFELYYRDFQKKLNLFFVAKAWFGGLRQSLRCCVEPELEPNRKRRAILESYPCFYRYSQTESAQDMADIFFFFSKTYLPHQQPPQPSGRYEDIFVEEFSDDMT